MVNMSDVELEMAMNRRPYKFYGSPGIYYIRVALGPRLDQSGLAHADDIGLQESDCFKYPFATNENQNLLTRAGNWRQPLVNSVEDPMRPSAAWDNVWNARLSDGLLIS